MTQTMLPNYVPKQCSQTMIPINVPKRCSQTMFQTMLPNDVPKQCSQTMIPNNAPSYVAKLPPPTVFPKCVRKQRSNVPGRPANPASSGENFDDLNTPNNFEGPVRMRNPVAHTEPKPNYPKTKLTKHIPLTNP